MSDIKVGIVMGSDSDWPVMNKAVQVCAEFAVGCETRVISAHRTPRETAEWAEGAAKQGIGVLIAGAGGAAALPGVVAASTTLPVIGVPVANGPLNGVDSLLSIVQMPPGIPVATVGVNRADNAALLAIQILGLADQCLAARFAEYRARLRGNVDLANDRVRGFAKEITNSVYPPLYEYSLSTRG